MKRYLLIYKECIRVAFATASTYRMNFFLNSVIMLLGDILFPLVTILIYGSGAGFEGWSVYEVLLIQSVFTISMAIADMTFNGILWATMGAVREGNFEMTLLMPVDTMFLLMARTFSIDAIGLFLGGLAIFIISLTHIGAPSLLMWLQFFAMFLMGLLVMMGIALMMAATSFKWVGNSRIPEIFDSVRSFGKYPQSIFPKTVLVISSYLIPVAMIGFFPAAVLMGRGNYAMFLAVIPCALFMMLGIVLYRSMVRLYQGVGG
jgi:ABC-2 type transport system permease protein